MDNDISAMEVMENTSRNGSSNRRQLRSSTIAKRKLGSQGESITGKISGDTSPVGVIRTSSSLKSNFNGKSEISEQKLFPIFVTKVKSTPESSEISEVSIAQSKSLCAEKKSSIMHFLTKRESNVKTIKNSKLVSEHVNRAEVSENMVKGKSNISKKVKSCKTTKRKSFAKGELEPQRKMKPERSATVRCKRKISSSPPGNSFINSADNKDKKMLKKRARNSKKLESDSSDIEEIFNTVKKKTDLSHERNKVNIPEKQHVKVPVECHTFCFPKFSHCTQLTDVDFIYPQSDLLLLINEVDDDIIIPKWKGFVGLLDDSVITKNGQLDLSCASNTKSNTFGHNSQNCNLENLELGSDSAVDDLMWTDIYEKERYSSMMNNPSAMQLKNWLLEWKSKFADKSHQHKNKSSDNSSCSDDDSDLENCVLITGPPGCGKTSLVNSLAADLGYKVLEVNASSCRSGRHIQSQLREAFQSYYVDPPSFGSSGSQHIKTENSNYAVNEPINKRSRKSNKKDIRSFFGGGKSNEIVSKSKVKSTEQVSKGGGKSDKKTLKNSSEKVIEIEKFCDKKKISARKPCNLSLILFDDVDVVLEGDDGFWTTINSFLRTARKPVVLTANRNFRIITSSLSVPHKRIELESTTSEDVIRSLKLPYDSSLQKTSVDLDLLPVYNSDDVRRCLLSLQFWSKHVENAVDASPSNFSAGWVLQKSEILSDFQSVLFSNKPLSLLTAIMGHFLIGFDLLHDNLFSCLLELHDKPRTTWKFTVPQDDLSLVSDCDSVTKESLEPQKMGMTTFTKVKKSSSKGNIKSLLHFSTLLENFSFSDYIKGERKRNSERRQPTSEKVKQWCDGFPCCTDDSFQSVEDFVLELVSVINILNVHQAKKMLEVHTNNSVTAKQPSKLNFNSLPEAVNSVSQVQCVALVLPIAHQLNLRAIILDYVSALKTVCRSEAVRQSRNLKRSSRFLHYLDSISMHFDTSDILHLQK